LGTSFAYFKKDGEGFSGQPFGWRCPCLKFNTFVPLCGKLRFIVHRVCLPNQGGSMKKFSHSWEAINNSRILIRSPMQSGSGFRMSTGTLLKSEALQPHRIYLHNFKA